MHEDDIFGFGRGLHASGRVRRDYPGSPDEQALLLVAQYVETVACLARRPTRSLQPRHKVLEPDFVFYPNLSDGDLHHTDALPDVCYLFIATERRQALCHGFVRQISSE